MPAQGQEETVRIVALDRDFHEQCYRCEVRDGLACVKEDHMCAVCPGIRCLKCSKAALSLNHRYGGRPKMLLRFSSWKSGSLLITFFCFSSETLMLQKFPRGFVFPPDALGTLRRFLFCAGR